MSPREKVWREFPPVLLKVAAGFLGLGALGIVLWATILSMAVPNQPLPVPTEKVKEWLFLATAGIVWYYLLRWTLALVFRKNTPLTSREAYYRTLFERMENGFAVHQIICSPSGVPVDYRFLEFNPGYEKITGLKAQDVVGRTAGELFPDLEPFWIEAYGKVGITGEPAHFGGYLKALGRYYEVSAFCTEPCQVAVLCSDVTEKRLVEIELNRLHQALEERVRQRTAQYVEANDQLKEEIAQRVRAEEEINSLNAGLLRQKSDLEATNRELEAFSFSVSHDLRAPLRHIGAFAKILNDEHAAQLDEKGRGHLERIARACDAMGRLIEELLKLSRITRSEMHLRRLDLSRMAEVVAEELRVGDPSRTVEFRIEPGVVALGDEVLIEIVLQNLIGNAYKYTAKREGAMIEFGSYRQEGKEHYFVRDNGAGFNMRYADKLFSAFQRLHRQEDFEGTGVGLALVQRIIHRHGGQIRGEGEPERGATFRFTLQ